MADIEDKDQTVGDTDFSDLPKFKSEMPIFFCPKGKTNYKLKEGDQNYFSKLDDVLSFLPKDQVIHIELRDTNCKESVRQCVKIIQKHKRHKTTILGCQQHLHNQLIRELDPEIATSADTMDCIKTVLKMATGLLPYMDVPYQSLTAPYLTNEMIGMYMMRSKKKESDNCTRLDDSMITNILFFFSLPTTILFQYLNARGALTSYHVINDHTEMEHIYLNSFAAGVVTDRPKYMREELKNLEK